MAFPDDPMEIRAEIALGADINADPDTWTWTDISDYVRTADGAKVVVRRGRRNDSGSTTPATASFDLNNADGRFCTQFPTSPYYPDLAVNTPVKISVSTDSGSTWSVRYSGYLSKLPTSWRGPAGDDSWVSVTAESVLRRLGQESGRSALQRSAPNLPSGNQGCVEYWPIEDGQAATQAASYFQGGIPMTASGSLEFGRSSPPPGSAATAFSDHAFMKSLPPSLTGIVRPYTDTGVWTILGCFKTDEDSAVDMVLLDADINHGESSADPDQVRLILRNDRFLVEAYREDGTLLGSVNTGALSVEPGDGDWHAFAIRASQSGADVSIRLRYEGSNYTFTLTGKTVGTIRKVAFPSTFITTAPETLSVGHLAVYDDDLSTSSMDRFAEAMDAHLTAAGEEADDRLNRVEVESDLVYSIVPGAAEVAMYERLGEQGDATALGIIQDTVEADGGILYEPKDFADGSLHYLARSQVCANAIGTPALTLTQSDYSVIEQGDDDHYLATKVTVTGAGSSASAADAVIENEVSESRNIRFPERLPDHAGWALYQGTRRDYRYPRIRILLQGATSKIAAWKDIEVGDRVLVTDPPPGVVDDIDLIMEGYSESMDQYSWEVEPYCSPASRYRIARLDDTTFGRMDTAGSRLVNAVTSSSTTLEVETYEGAEWLASDGLTLPGTAGAYASTPNHSSLQITGDIEFEFDIDPVLWASGATQSVVGKIDTGQRSYLASVRSTGELGFGYSTDGSALTTRVSTVAVPQAGRKQCKIEVDTDNGAGGHTVRFYTRVPGTPSWTQLGTDVTTAGTITMFTGTAPLEVGANTLGTSAVFNGVIRYATVRSGIGGTAVANPDFTLQPYGTTSFTDAAGRTWTVYDGAKVQASFGLSVGVGGERMTLGGAQPAFTDTFTRSVSSGWGTSDSGHAWSTTGGSASDYSTNGTRGLISINAVNSLRSTYISALSVADIDRTITVRVPVLATGAGILVRQAARWNISTSDYLAGAVQVETSGAVTAALSVVVAGTLVSSTGKTVPGLTHSTTTDYRLRFKLNGPWMYVKVWVGTEPPQWSMIVYDTQVTAAGAWGVRARVNTGNTNTLPVSIQVDDDATLTPQKFTVTRSVNTVVKAHSAGDAVGLFQPNHLGL